MQVARDLRVVRPMRSTSCERRDPSTSDVLAYDRSLGMQYSRGMQSMKDQNGQRHGDIGGGRGEATNGMENRRSSRSSASGGSSSSDDGTSTSESAPAGYVISPNDVLSDGGNSIWSEDSDDGRDTDETCASGMSDIGAPRNVDPQDLEEKVRELSFEAFDDPEQAWAKAVDDVKSVVLEGGIPGDLVRRNVKKVSLVP